MENKQLLTIIAIAAVFIGGTLLWNAIQPIISQYGQQQQAADQITDRVTDADYAVRNYEWFIDQREKIKAMERQINNTRDAMQRVKDTYGNDTTDWSRQTRNQYNRELTELQGYQNQHENLVAEYNAHMNSSVRNLYNNSLPLEMEDKFWTGDLVP